MKTRTPVFALGTELGWDWFLHLASSMRSNEPGHADPVIF